jgi:hypothetical protein
LLNAAREGEGAWPSGTISRISSKGAPWTGSSPLWMVSSSSLVNSGDASSWGRTDWGAASTIALTGDQQQHWELLLSELRGQHLKKSQYPRTHS